MVLVSTDSATGKEPVCFGVCSLRTSNHLEHKLGPNGMPLAPASIRVLGRFETFKHIRHEHLCAYVDLIRCNSDRVLLIGEHYGTSIADYIASERNPSPFQISTVCAQVLHAFQYLHGRHITIAHFSLESLRVTNSNPLKIKVSNYALHNVTEAGLYAQCILSIAEYAAPELYASACKQVNGMCSQAADIWAFGIALFEMLIVRCLFHVGENDSTCVFDHLLGAVRLSQTQVTVPEDCELLVTVCKACLHLLPSKRANAQQLLDILSTSEHNVSCDPPLQHAHLHHKFTYRPPSTKQPPLLSAKQMLEQKRSEKQELLGRHLSLLPIDELFVLCFLLDFPSFFSVWVSFTRKTQEGNLQVHFMASGSLVREECVMLGNEQTDQTGCNLRVIALPINHLQQKFSEMPSSTFVMSLSRRFERGERHPADEMMTLDPDVKEKSIEYQIRRMLVFRRLIRAYPFKEGWLWQETAVDIAPLYRAQVWGCLLHLGNDCNLTYNLLDTYTCTATDRQLDVDIPRCHQYDELMSSPTAHGTLKRVIKAWLCAHPQYVYWQGLDSLTAPFVYLHMNRPDIAVACVSAFIERYAHDFFLKDNSAVIQEYLCTFGHVIAFHDPELHTHLVNIEFTTDLYAIPWFLTMFAHVLPLHKLFHLWDALLQRRSGYALCVGVAILLQLRPTLMQYQFNECILLFSDLPALDMHRCVRESIVLYDRTPCSVLYRAHASKHQHSQTVQGGSDNENTIESVPNGIKLDLSALSLTELRSLPCPRMSLRDLLRLTHSHKLTEQAVLIVDARPIEQYHRFSLPQSAHVSCMDLQDQSVDEPLPAGAGSELVDRVRHTAVLAVLGGAGCTNQALVQLAARLVRLGHSRVCLLNETVESVRRCHLLNMNEL